MSNSSGRRLVIIFLGIPVACLAGILIFWQFVSIKTASERESRAIERTKTEIQQIFIPLGRYFSETGRLPAGLSTNTAEIDTKQLYTTLFEEFNVLAPPNRWRKSENLVDHWGNAFNIRMHSSDGNLEIEIWSNGPNGKNEMGQGDDIGSSAKLSESN